MIVRRSFLLLLAAILVVVLSASSSGGEPDPYRVSLNGLEFTFDRNTGVLLSLSHRVAGQILKSSAASGGLLDLAYPVQSFTGRRLAARFSQVRFVPQNNGVRIVWDRMGASRNNLDLPDGSVMAEVSLAAASNGKSVILTSRIENRSQAEIPQILFPDFAGIQPFAGLQDTRMRVGNQIVTPFAEPPRSPGDSSFYVRAGWRTFDASKPTMPSMSALQTSSVKVLRRLDLVGSKGSLSIRNHGVGSTVRRILTHRLESQPDAMRLMWEHHETVKPGQKWESEFWLTPYQGPWINGSTDVHELNFNGLQVAVSRDNGNIVALSHPATGQMLEGLFGSSGLLEVEVEPPTHGQAKPKKQIDLINRPGAVLSDRDALVLSTGSSRARLAEDGLALNVFWEELRPEANHARMSELEGKVSAQCSVGVCQRW